LHHPRMSQVYEHPNRFRTAPALQARVGEHGASARRQSSRRLLANGAGRNVQRLRNIMRLDADYPVNPLAAVGSFLASRVTPARRALASKIQHPRLGPRLDELHASGDRQVDRPLVEGVGCTAQHRAKVIHFLSGHCDPVLATLVAHHAIFAGSSLMSSMSPFGQSLEICRELLSVPLFEGRDSSPTYGSRIRTLLLTILLAPCMGRDTKRSAPGWSSREQLDPCERECILFLRAQYAGTIGPTLTLRTRDTA